MATKPATKTTAKPAAKPAAKAVTKSASKAAPKPVARNTTVARQAKPASAAKETVIMQSQDAAPEIAPEIAPETAAKVVASMRVKDLIERVAEASDHKKNEVKTIVEATLVELGRALEAGESLNLPPFGKIRIANQKGDASGQMMTLKLRRGGEKKPGKNAQKEALAEESEAS